MDKNEPVLIVIRGLPGSGKSYLASRLARALQNVVVLDPDSIDQTSNEYIEHAKKLTEEGVDAKLHNYRFLREQAYTAIAARQIIIWNQPFSSLEIFEKMIARLKDCAAENNTNLKVLIIEIEIDAAIASARVETRKAAGGHGPSAATFARFVSDNASFASAGYQTISISGNAAIAESVENIKMKLATISSVGA